MVRRLALVGCGAVSRNYYVPACRKLSGCVIEWFVDTNIKKAEELAKIYGAGKISRNYREAMADVDAAIVALPNSLHAEASVNFLEQCRDVLCEKPIAANTVDALKMIEASRRCGARLMINLARRRLNSYRIVKSLLDRKHFAKIEQVSCEEGYIFDWPVSSESFLKKAGGGVFLDWGAHIVDLLQWLFAANLQLVSYADDGHGGVEANADAQLTIKPTDMAEIPCRIVLSRTRRLRNSLLVRGDDFLVEVRHRDPDVAHLWVDGHSYRIKADKEKSTLDCFVDQLASFLDKSRDDYVGGVEALHSLEFIEHCYANRTKITFPWETKQPSANLAFPSNYRTILVVGASGFLGTRLAEKLSLDLNLKVRATIHRAETASRVGRLPLEFVDCDLLDLEQVMNAVMGCDVVVNCARDRVLDKGRILDFYVKGTSNLLKAALKHKVKKFVHISTAAVHGFRRQEGLIDEKCRFARTRDRYVAGKIKSERLVIAHARFLPVVILRPTLMYGPYSRDWGMQIIERLKKQRTTIVGDKGLANLIHVDDVVDAILLAIQRNEGNGEAYIVNNDREKIRWNEYVQRYSEALGITPNVSSDSNLTIRRLANVLLMMKDSLFIAKDLITSPESLALAARIPLILRLGDKMLKGKKRKAIEDKLATPRALKVDRNLMFKYETIDRQLYNVFTSRAVMSSAKARAVLGFEPHVPFEEGIANTIEWVKWWSADQPETF